MSTPLELSYHWQMPVVLSADPCGGRTEKCAVPTALLVNGHSTLFGWLLRHAPEAELDKGSQKTLERLRLRGLVE
jgi:hypothetical protein